ncbi:MAG: hypothetical protein ONB48_06385 [candidate division KSB1 bacterium]|nr:hypothetical protein [candidate division KSB1 bacterium]MDZ7285270.1 hypothetical protein [candidate division KSB1 bacterium]MDZ7298302.1 hypothetical protein [candidate division KSB1 bacterium]MDZ7309616.1 hypothetical protein [candidate division KSB1 bacterium]MDZ7349065.1 hypothetical protein [candidate division KSB1 bacterium]
MAVNQKEARREFRVRHVTLDAVYFNGGSVLGVRAGDKVWVMRNGERLLPLEVKYVSEHSASCLLETGAAGSLPQVKIDDPILWVIPLDEYLKRVPPATEPKSKPAAAAPARRPVVSPPKRYAGGRRPSNNEVTGHFSLQSYGQRDQGPQSFDFQESSAYLRLQVERLGGLPVRLLARTRSVRRSQQPGTGVWQTQPVAHRVYEVALEWEAATSPVEFAVGRMLRHDLRGVGYLDGMALSYRLGPRWKAGLFGGFDPDLSGSGMRAAGRKIGGALQMKTPVRQAGELTLAVTGVGQYRGGEISREFLAAQTELNWPGRFYLMQYAELDLNRAWRTASGGALALSNAYFNLTCYPQEKISLGLSYDARRLIRTWETRTLADSLFDASLRQGWRGQVSYQPTALYRIAIDGGWQGQGNAPAVYSAGIMASAAELWRSGFSVNARFSYFGNALARGYYPGLEISRRLLAILSVSLGGGVYAYRMTNPAATQNNPWERLRLDAHLNRAFFLSATVERFHGDTMRFVRGFGELGWRF